MSKKNRKPTWNLTEGYGCSCDAYNWVLLKRSGEGWKLVGYYPTPEKLLMGLYRKMCRNKPAGADLLTHLSTLQERVQAVAARLSEELNQMVWAGLQRPPAHRKPNTNRGMN